MLFIPAIHTYKNDIAAQHVWQVLSQKLGDVEGYAYYKHPSLGTRFSRTPDLAVLAKGYDALVTRVLDIQVGDIEEVGDETWVVNGKEVYSPVIELEDLKVALTYRFDQEHRIRKQIKVIGILAMPNIAQAELKSKFPKIHETCEGWKDLYKIWRDGDDGNLPRQVIKLDETSWRLAKSVFQSASELNRGQYRDYEKAQTLGEAIRILDRTIALLDDQQNKVAIQIPPGPQMIRGLAGTGKTVLLAMKAANIHAHFPDARVLFTFNTQSLYNQSRDLISRFYRHNRGCDPDWSFLQIRHGWGGKTKEGVYSDLCARQGLPPFRFDSARIRDPEIPFRACCAEALKYEIEPFYDYVLVDEAQDFPKEFFQLLWKLTPEPHQIYFAFDELQSLSTFEIPSPEELFGTDPSGKPLVTLEGEYDGPMDKMLLLNKSYRCHQNVLMLAHAIGLGIHNPRGCIQMIFDRTTWEAIGYEIEKGKMVSGQEIIVKRPQENSPNLLETVYKGKKEVVLAKIFEKREDEIKWIAEQIEEDINKEKVSPERILVISMNSREAKTYMGMLQNCLHEKNVGSIIPGLMDDKDEFAVEGRVTLSTVYRAKGNEAPIVYILSFDSLYDYVREVGMRNRAFTSISRSKAWVRITGVGENMKGAMKEISKILKDIPYMKFIFPDKEKITRNLDPGETTRRMQDVKRAKRTAHEIKELELGALADLDPKELDALVQKLQKARSMRVVDK